MIGVLDRRGRRVPGRTSTPPEAPRSALPGSLFVMAVGVLLVALADNAGRHGSTAAVWITAYWVGEVVVFAPVVLRLVTRERLADTEAVSLVLGLATATYLLKYLYSPLSFGFPDELAHWRTTTTLLQSHHLFGVNYGLPVSPLYPGLEEATGAVASTTGLSVFVAGLIVAGLAHLVTAAALYLVFRRVGGSAWLAAAAVTVYAMSPHYQVFDAIFGYQTPALAFFALTLVAAGHLTGPTGAGRWWAAVAALLTATVVTHHVTSYALAATFALLAAVAAVRWWRTRKQRMAIIATRYAVVAGSAVCLIVAWIVFVAPATVSYLQPTAADFLGGIRSALAAHTTGSNATPAGPFVDQLGNYAAAGLIMLTLPLGWRRIWRTQRHNVWALAMAVGSIAYYVIVGLRLTTPDGAELAGRSLTFLYVPIGYVLANALAWLLHVTTPVVRRLAPGLAAMAGVVVLLGGMAAGWPPYWEQLPGRFLVDGFESGISPEGVAVTSWAAATFGDGANGMAADFTNYVLLSGYGGQNVVSDADELYCSPQWTQEDERLARSLGIGYVVVDLRMSEQKPATGTYFADQSTKCPSPVPRRDLLKFDAVPGVSRIYDSGDIIVYDLRVVTHAP